MTTPISESMTKEELMKLIARLNGWSDGSSRVKAGFMPKRVYTDVDSSYIDDSDWGWVVSTTICGMPKESNEVYAQGKKLETALLALAKAIVDRFAEMRDVYARDHERARKQLDGFVIDKGANVS